jgi:aspartyl-tRNA(Asn)/glutamyl-tRNA(Gln) amidotransferase subunit A
VRSALESGRLLAAGELDAEAECEAALARAAAAGPVFTRLTAERARVEARAAAARLRAGEPASPLDGVPVTWKDLVDVAGTPTTAASDLRRELAPADADAPAVARLAAAGLVCVGKTNLSELAFSGLGLNPHFGTPPNPLDPARAPGGSSSGSAVAVATGVVPCAVGTDTSGSIRVPAAFCGIAGFKPSLARVDRGGVVALAPSMDSVGPLAHTVADLIALDAALRGAWPAAGDSPAAADASAAADAAEASATDLSAAAGSLRFVVAEGEPVDDLDPGVAASFAAAVDALAAAGARVERRPVAALAEASALLRERGTLVAHEAWREHEALLDGPGAGRLDRRVLRRLRDGRALPAAGHAALLRARPRLQATFAEELGGALLLTPTAPHVAPAIAPLEADDDVFLAANARTLRITMPASYLDAPGVALPIGPAEAGLPASLLVSGPSSCDDRVLAGALAAEAALRAAARAR